MECFALAESCPEGFEETIDSDWRFCLNPGLSSTIPNLMTPPVAGIPYVQAEAIRERHSVELGQLPGVTRVGLGAEGIIVLTDHPEVAGSQRKEASYFTPLIYGQAVAPIAEYEALFSHYAGEKIVMEATPGYFIGGRLIAERISATLGPDVKVLLSLRDPITRLMSFYSFAVARMYFDRETTLAEYVQLCESSPSVTEAKDEKYQKLQGYYGGFYATALPDWFDVFGDRLRIAFFEDLKADPQRFMVGLADWLDIDRSNFESRSYAAQNPSRAYRVAAVHRVAHQLNDRAEYALRRHPDLKNRLRSWYERFNASKARVDVAPELMAHLKETYAASNERTRELLMSHGYVELPAWLTSATA